MPVLGKPGDLRASVVRCADRIFAERVRFSFFRKGDVDPTRPPADITAVLRVGGGDERNLAGGLAKDWSTQIAAGKAELHVDRDAFPSLTVREDDRVCALDRPGLPWFQVLRVDDRGDTRLVLALGEI
ncbi:hypothetical protein NS226_13860 [Aureimonas ureilytica]|uniref:Uncharacterized protein n=1 Tax=Aureimonas ureilytica TaxID=401562 RepID=A0A175R6D9_9HYPH|nr:hypothetical protein [Aureimonas ureilytica]KTQ95012.1 hypothetical protein NS226_13860 [Aureimonas ureilytica]